MNTGYRDPRFAELDRLIAEEDAREALQPKPPVAPRLLEHNKRERARWAEMRSRRDTCKHEKWRFHGPIQIMCLGCGTTRMQWELTPEGPKPL